MSDSGSVAKNTKVAVIGGGLAGIAAAAILAREGFPTTLYESRKSLGGRAGSYLDRQSGEEIDNCQHVSMGCCTNLQAFCEMLGLEEFFSEERELVFVGPENSQTTFGESFLPAPFHLTPSFMKLPYLSWAEKREFASGIRALSKTDPAQLSGVSFEAWLKQNGQSESVIQRVWHVVLVSALSESIARIDAKYAQKVFFDGFLANRQGWRVLVPNRSLAEIYSSAARERMHGFGLNVELNTRLEELQGNQERICGARFRNCEQLVEADDFVLAVPPHQVGKLVSSEVASQLPIEQFEQIQTAPITSVHLWFDREITPLRHSVLVDRVGQWLFNRQDLTELAGDDVHRYQVVVSDSRNFESKTNEEVINTVVDELKEIWPAAESATIVHARVITERRAVFSAVPGIDSLRPKQSTTIDNLFLAGDWTQTGWPATMEGAVRSGFLAAESLLRKYGLDRKVVVDDLPVSRLSRWIFGNSPRKSS
ncbi:15-cis-phytoene desaturase [Thalassoglobus neptunius]|uniref:15-cis-phytoene desaturase n=1 Tax=Thalassoglobus neptunius TaxID=1938619 RepID=A0A5C5X5E4_9PLAN|nr:hydroxysqualene dehydroxylase HpnE [Thalassoglobus neptunius]TWT58150.1 15-cis-phytoene desaturase [Thalassoglobus neptunius]